MKHHTLVLSLFTVALTACGSVETGGSGPDAEPAPVASAVSPDHGPFAGGNTVTVTGSGFTAPMAGDANVIVGGFAASDVSATGDGTVTFTAPPGIQPGSTVDVTVFDQDGFVTLPMAYRYNELPLALSISPPRGRSTGGTAVTIIGRGFQDLEAGSPTVTIDGVAATNANVVDDRTITATTGAMTSSAGFAPLDIVVDNANGSATLEGGFSVTKPGLLTMPRCCGNLPIVWLDPTTGAAQVIGNVDSQTSQTNQLWSCALSPGGTVFCSGSLQGSGAPTLFTFDPLAGTATAIGPMSDANGGHKLRSIAFAGANLYGISMQNNPGNFFSINTSTGAVALIVNLPFSRPSAIGPKDASSFYYTTTSTAALQTLNVNGTLSAGATLQGSGAGVWALGAFGSGLFMCERTGNVPFEQVTPATGAITPLGNVNVQCHTLFATPASF